MKKQSRPDSDLPLWVSALLERFWRTELVEELQGDLAEAFEQRLMERGSTWAHVACVWDLVGLLRPSLIGWGQRERRAGSLILLRPNLTLAWRKMQRAKGTTFISVSSLALGLACSLLVLLYVRDELSYDRFHQNADRIFKAHMEMPFGGQRIPVLPPGALYHLFLQDVPTVTHAVRLRTEDRVAIEINNERFYETGFAFADPALFEVFDFPLVNGNPQTALERPFTVVLSETVATKYFGETNPIGQTLLVDGEHPYEVTGILRDVPHNSHVQLTFVASVATLPALEIDLDTWGPGNAQLFFLREEGVDLATLEKALPDLITKYLPDWDPEISLFFEPLTEVYLGGRLLATNEIGGDIRYVYVFGAIGLVLLVLGSLNYMNLATARALGRAREVGVRKVAGAHRKQLISQFLTESLCIGLVALGLAWMVAYALLPEFGLLVGKALARDLLLAPAMVGLGLGLTVLVSVIGGSYPAFFLSALRPVGVLKGAVMPGKGNRRLSHALVVVQFTATIALLVGTLIIQQQLDYIQTKRLGLNEEQVLVIRPTDELKPQYAAFKNELLQQPGVLGVTTAPFPDFEHMFSIRYDGMPADMRSRYIATFQVDYDFAETLEIDIVEGRMFDRDRPGDFYGAVLINEATADDLGWEEPLGKTIRRLDENYKWVESEVIGVVRDFHNQSLKETISPKVIQLTNTMGRFGKVLVRIAPDDANATVEALAETWAQFAPAHPFSYTFLDTEFASFYEAEQRLGRLFSIFAVLAVLVACLGLFGVSAYTAARRTREIGVRKVLGASVGGVVVLIGKEFMLLILLAVGLALPLAYIGTQEWLASFAYRADINVVLFLGAGGVVILMAWIAMGYQVTKAALTNPVDALRHE